MPFYRPTPHACKTGIQMLFGSSVNSILLEESMVHPRILGNPPPDGPGPRRRFTIPPGVPVPDHISEYEVENPEQLDRRLKGYQLVCSVSEPPPAAPNRSPVPLIPLHGNPIDGWQLWLAILWWPGSAVTGELRYQDVYGWGSAIFYRQATSHEITRIAHGLEVLQQRVRPPGRPKGQRSMSVGSKYDDLDSFLADARRERDLHRQRGKPFDEQSLAGELGLDRRTFQRALARCGLKWKAFTREPTLPCDKIF
jgi:hypothetical protein